MKRFLLVLCVIISSCTKQILCLESGGIVSSYPEFTMADSLLTIEVELRVPNYKTDKLRGVVKVTNSNNIPVKWNWNSMVLKINGEEVNPDLPNSNIVTYAIFFEIPAGSTEKFQLHWDLENRQEISVVEPR